MAAAIASRSPMALTVLVITYNAPRAAEGAGSDVLFISHDMILTRACVAELAALREAQSGQGFGVLRPRSGHMDFAAKMALAPPTPVRDQDDAETFAAAVREQFGGQ